MARKLDHTETNQLDAMVCRTSRAEVLRFLMEHRTWSDHTGGRINKVEITENGKLILSI